MKTSPVSLDLMQFVETEILPRYNNFDRAHNLSHALAVIDASLRLASAVGADSDMSYAIAAYHDLGLEGPRAVHHITSKKILLADNRLKRWFTPDQLKIMGDAVEDHRASASRAPRSIYGRIVAEADRDLRPQTVIERTILYGKDHYPEKSTEEHWERLCNHLKEKYSEAGYIKLWIQGSDNEKHLAELRNLINDKQRLRQLFDQLFSKL